jgi:transcriptional regulator with XRE-family HTH domain
MARNMKHKREFKVEDYKHRLALLREIISGGEGQAEFAAKVGIPFKRWNSYERGYPIPRETAFLLLQKFDGISVEWLWFDMRGNLSEEFLRKLQEVEDLHRQRDEAAHLMERAQAALSDVDARLKKASSEKKPPTRRARGSDETARKS